VNTNSPDLDGLQRSGHKLLVYHGWADWLVVPDEAIRYHDAVMEHYSVVDADNPKTDVGDFYRLFMLPGVEHCAGGAGPNEIDTLSAVVEWVEHGAAPASIVATKHGADGRLTMQRPVCPYPQVAKYRGSGAENEALHSRKICSNSCLPSSSSPS
jgi:feruloyl esterase